MTKPGRKRGRPKLQTPHVKLCGYVPATFAAEVQREAEERGLSLGELIQEAFRGRGYIIEKP